MLEKVLTYLSNWFEKDVQRGSFTIADGSLSGVSIKSGQHYRIIGSIFNDGLHKHPDTGLTDETFDGEVWLLAIPAAVTDLADEIEDWVEDNSKALDSPYTAESFGGYSYSKPTANAAENASDGWRRHFASELRGWMRL